MNLLSYIFRAVQIAPYQGVGTLTPPTLAPILTVEADLGSEIANLSWTDSNKTGTSGFGYAIWRQVSNDSWIQIDSVGPSTLAYNDNTTGIAPNLFSYYIVPFNSAGEGPSSNTVSIYLPGESEAPLLTGPSSVESGDPTALLEWNAIPGATLYSVQRSPDGSTWTQIYTPTGTSQSVTLSFSPSYYRVIPFAGTFEGLPSNSISITIVSPPVADSYLRPDGTSTYLRPDGTSIYLRP
jgi:hypothetical protein